MPVLTPNYALPVPGPLDAPCDFAQQWCDFTDATQAVLDEFEAIADRTNPVVPVAKMIRTTAVPLANTSFVPFESLIINNANMIDFDANRTTAIIKRPGRYQVIFNVKFASNNVGNQLFFTQMFPAGASTINQTPSSPDTYAPSSAVDIGMTNTGVMHVTSPPVYVRVRVDAFAVGVTTVTVDEAALSVYWFADRATP